MKNKMLMRTSVLLITLFLICLFLTCFSVVSFAEESVKYVKLNYLQRIEGTPFAEKVQSDIKVPVYDNHVIKLNDVKKALKCKEFGVMQSFCSEFEYDEKTDEYTAVYYKSVYLNAKTVDGNMQNFYLDCNLSFEDYFKSFVDNEIMESGLYETFLNGLYLKYEGLSNYTADNIYGYFGLIAIPKGHNLNQVWADLFGSTTYSGGLEYFSYENVLTHTAYAKLLIDYQYSWLEIVWKTYQDLFTSGSANASFYIIYVDSKITEAYVAENGAGDINDNNGAIINGIEAGAQWVSEKISEFFSQDRNKPIIVILGLLLFIVIVYVIVLIGRKISKHVNKKNKR